MANKKLVDICEVFCRADTKFDACTESDDFLSKISTCKISDASSYNFHFVESSHAQETKRYVNERHVLACRVVLRDGRIVSDFCRLLF